MGEESTQHMSLLTARLAALDAAVPPVRKPAEMLGEVVFKQFKGHGTFIGTIMEYDAQTGFRLQYDDGDTEDVSWNDLRTMMMPRGTGEAMPPGPRERHAQSVKPNQYAIVPSVRRAVETPAPVAAAEEAVAAPAEPAAPLRPPAAAPPPGARKKQLLAAIARQQQHEELRADDAPAEKRPVAAPSVPPPPKKQKAAAAQGGVEQRKPKAPAAAAAPNAVDISQLPAGWMTEARGRNTVYISPDGLTQFSTLAKVRYASARPGAHTPTPQVYMPLLTRPRPRPLPCDPAASCVRRCNATTSSRWHLPSASSSSRRPPRGVSGSRPRSRRGEPPRWRRRRTARLPTARLPQMAPRRRLVERRSPPARLPALLAHPPTWALSLTLRAEAWTRQSHMQPLRRCRRRRCARRAPQQHQHRTLGHPSGRPVRSHSVLGRRTRTQSRARRPRH